MFPKQVTAAASKKKDVPTVMFELNPGDKEKRAQADMRLKWVHQTQKQDQVKRVKTLCEQVFGVDGAAIMFDSDHKDYIMALDRLNLMVEEQPENLIQVVDVVFKWAHLKLDESTNTAFIMKVYDFLVVLFALLTGSGYTLSDTEAYVVIPMLCEKSGNNNTIVKNKVKALIKQCFKIHDHTKCMALIVDFGCSSKNLKSVSESLDEIAAHITRDGLKSVSERQIKTVVRLVDHSDQGVKKGALLVLGQAYCTIEEDVWKMVGKVSPKVQDLLVKRFKQAKAPGLGGASPRGARSPQKQIEPSSLRKGRSPQKKTEHSTPSSMKQSGPDNIERKGEQSSSGSPERKLE